MDRKFIKVSIDLSMTFYTKKLIIKIICLDSVSPVFHFILNYTYEFETCVGETGSDDATGT